MKYRITKYYSGFCTYEIEAANEDEAWKKINVMPIDYQEIASNLEPWEVADESEEVV
jgi:hypothetical protein